MITGGGVWTMIGYAQQARDLLTTPFQPWQVQLSGFVVFFIGVVVMLYRFHAQMQATLVGHSPTPIKREVPAATPIPRQAEVPRVEAPSDEPEPAVAPVPGRQYAPEAFSEELLALTAARASDMRLSAFLAPHEGQWVRLRVQFWSATDHGDELYIHAAGLGQDGGDLLTIYFSPEWRSQVARLERYSEVRLVAQIVTIGHRTRLRNGELL
jgi:hypothetical protein